MAFIGVGYPGWPAPTQSWDWWPLVGIALALWFIRSVLGRAVGAIELVLSLVAGLGFASVVHAWGTPGGSAIILILVAAALALRRRAPRRTVPPV